MENLGGKIQAWINLILLVVLLISSGCIYLADTSLENINQEREQSYLDHIKTIENATLTTLMYLADIDFKIVDNQNPEFEFTTREQNETAKNSCRLTVTPIPTNLSETKAGVSVFGAKVNESQVSETITAAKLSTLKTTFGWETFWKYIKKISFLVQIIFIILAIIINIIWISHAFKRANWKEDFKEWWCLIVNFFKTKESINNNEKN